MSYSDERDEIAELFGAPSSKRKGYSDDLDTSSRSEQKENKRSDFTTKPSQPKAKVEVKKPVKLRPPADVPPHPLEVSSPPPVPAEPEVQDEEILVYDEEDPPDFSNSDFFSFDAQETKPQVPALPPKKESAPVSKPEARTAAHSELPPSRQAVAPSPPENSSPPAASPPPVPAAPTSTPQLEEKKAEQPPAIREDAPAPQASPAPKGEKLLLDTHGLVKIYDGRTVVNGVDINVHPGEIVGLLGPNGAGKTTSFYMIVGLVPPNGGRVLFGGQDVTNLPMYKRARIGMGYLPQEESIFRKLTVEENIMAVMETLKIPRKEKVARCNELLERFKITHIRKNVALTCSGGEKRRLTIARSLVTKPSLLMLDEPFSGVDPIAVNEIQNIVEDLRRSGLAILITDHNARQTLELVDRAYLIYEGKVLREGTRDFLINDPVSRELYLGDRFTM